ncbi:MAG: putative membrane protein [Myxococcota bacterium]|jgi:uncharacterized membrane protein
MAGYGWLLLSTAYLAGQSANGALALAVGLPWVGACLAAGYRWGRSSTTSLDRASLAVTGLCGVIATAWFLNYDSFLFRHGSCLSEDVFHCAGGLVFSFEPLDVSGLTGGQRLGSIAWPLPFQVLFGAEGFRLLYAVDALLTATAIAGLGRTLLGSSTAAALAAAIGTLNPYVFQVPVVDENTMGLALGSCALMLAMTDQPTRFRAAALGLLCGVLVALRHILLVALPGYAWAWLRDRPARQSRTQAAIAVVTLVITLLPAVYHHATFFGAGAWESRYSSSSSIGGVSVPTYQYLNWPVHETLVRTPFNPYPTSVMFPLRHVREWGLGLCAAAVFGLGVLYRRRRRDLGALLLVYAPVALTLAPLEQWTKPNKMGVILVVMMVPTLLAAAGLDTLIRQRTRHHLTGFAIAFLAVLLGWGTLATISTSVDPRTARHSQDTGRYFATERPGLLTAARRDLVDVGFLPALDGYGRFSEPFAAWKVQLSDPPTFPTRLASTTAHGRVHLDLISEVPKATATDSPGRAIADEVPVQVHGLTADWTPDALHALLLRRDGILFVLRVSDNLHDPAAWDPHSELQILYPGHKTPPLGAIAEWPNDTVLTVDAAALTHVIFIDVLSNSDELFRVYETGLNPLAAAPPRPLYLP